ncbi:uncharacterized protein LOC125027057 [Penaeus chinensis]|uniref:uncharacterized protein LOC125027057 n=1 Tax=Penaeus chinensis TaxID=139456 RepID=UPI001FB82BCC|nr:uncharacterized protein LOC125027057 [Penaeus chinensis]
MARLETTVLMAAMLYWVALAENPALPTLQLFTQTNSKGAVLTINRPYHNLGDVGFDDVTQSICGFGLWFLYANEGFSKKSDFVLQFASPSRHCKDLEFSQRDKVTSARYAGTEDFTHQTLTLYKDENQCGDEILVLKDNHYISHFNDEATSFAVTGNSNWTLYDDADFGGDSACLIPFDDAGWYYGVWNEVGLGNDVVSSVKKGCHSDNIVKYDPTK